MRNYFLAGVLLFFPDAYVFGNGQVDVPMSLSPSRLREAEKFKKGLEIQIEENNSDLGEVVVPELDGSPGTGPSVEHIYEVMG